MGFGCPFLPLATNLPWMLKCKGKGKANGKNCPVASAADGNESAPRKCAREGCNFSATWHPTHCCAGCAKSGGHGGRCKQQIFTPSCTIPEENVAIGDTSAIEVETTSLEKEETSESWDWMDLPEGADVAALSSDTNDHNDRKASKNEAKTETKAKKAEAKEKKAELKAQKEQAKAEARAQKEQAKLEAQARKAYAKEQKAN